MNSPGQAPKYNQHRLVKQADVGPFETRNVGLNCTECETVNIQIVVKPGDSVTAKMYSWCDADETFIPIADTVTYGPYTTSTEFQYFANGRILFIALTGTVTGSSIHASRL